MTTLVDPIEKLTRDLKHAAATLTPSEVRYLVDSYYQTQEDRKRAKNQLLAVAGDTAQDDATNPIVRWVASDATRFEHNIKLLLGEYSQSHPVGRWAESITGIGPVISAGLLAHIDIAKCPTVGHIWRFAGLDPTVTWEKGHKRPWNARLKVLTWKVGESFVKTSNLDSDIYGHLWRERKAYEEARNERGELAGQAAAMLAHKKIGKDTDAYKAYIQGKLPPAHIHARAKRWTVKLYLAHWHHVAYVVANGVPPPKPYILTQPGHAHYIAPPNWPMP